jgi:hypothetical protein
MVDTNRERYFENLRPSWVLRSYAFEWRIYKVSVSGIRRVFRLARNEVVNRVTTSLTSVPWMVHTFPGNHI